MSRNMEQLLYEKRLNRLRLFSLKNRWLRKNMIKVYKTVIVQRRQIRNYYVLVFIIQEQQGSTWRYRIKKFKLPKRGVFFRWFIITLWSSFSSKVVGAQMEKCILTLNIKGSSLRRGCRHYRAHCSKLLGMSRRKKSIKGCCAWKPSLTPWA